MIEKTKNLLVAFLTLIALGSCVGNGENAEETDASADSIALADSMAEAVPQLNQVAGTVGEGTSMHSLELLLGDGNSMYFFYENNAIGGISAGDEVSVTYDKIEGELTAINIVNLTALTHLWKVEGQNQHLEINSKGRLTTYGMKDAYNKWTIAENQIILSGNQLTDTLGIQLLTADSLIIANENKSFIMSKEN